MFLPVSPTFHCFFGLKDPDCLTDEASTLTITDTGHVNRQFSSCQSWHVPQAVKAAAEHWTKTVSNLLVSLCEADLNIKTQLTQFSLHSFCLWGNMRTWSHHYSLSNAEGPVCSPPAGVCSLAAARPQCPPPTLQTDGFQTLFGGTSF